MAKKKSRARQSDATLADHRQALDAACKSLPQLIVLEGGEDFLRRHALESLIAAIRQSAPDAEDISISPPPGGAPALARLLCGELASTSLFSSNRILRLNEADLLWTTKKGAEDAGASDSAADSEKSGAGKRKRAATDPRHTLAERVTDLPPGTWLILGCDKLNKGNKLGKALGAAATIVSCPVPRRAQEVRGWLAQAAKDAGKSLDPAAIDALLTAHGPLPGVLHAELGKIVLFVGERVTIALDDVEAFLTGTVDFDIFQLLQAIESRKLSAALSLVRRVLAQGTRDAAGKRSDGASSAHRALYMIATTAEQLLQTRILVANGASANDIAASVGLSPWRAGKLAESCNRFSVKELRSFIRAVSEQIRASHDTGHDVALSLERVVLSACRKSPR